MRWRIYYGDGTTYGDKDGSSWDAPARNVQLLVGFDPYHEWVVLRSCDYYWYYPQTDSWYSGDIFGLFDYLIEPGQKRVLFGRSIPDSEYQPLLERAMNDPDMPQKTGWQPYERKP